MDLDYKCEHEIQHCDIINQKDRVRNDRVTQRCDENEENDSRRMMTGRSHGAKRSHEENPTPLANRITSRTPIFNSSLATRIEQGSNEKHRINSSIVDKRRR
ncbi:hypothetical protein PCANC_12035 [Puccinia coronata f. sp. avenae]|uniref:Uncharacterized protein n=1 Tax=Puccinia coronata f. sp. avenae TaxID=200324 RepID=A0A2N5UUJ0_9BASI|nr:hypothetical protein PCANC_12035 [Puccinia coronata f. sp. avenae]